MEKNMAKTKSGNIAQFERSRGQRYTEYVEGNTVRKAAAFPAQERGVHEVSQQVIRNRERARHMDMRYVVFLSVCAVLTVMICISFLKQQTICTYNQKRVTELTTKLNNLKIENDTTYNEIVSGVDLQKLKQRAIDDLGMTYPSQSQIVTYQSPDSDYVKQYGEIPSK